MLHIAVHHDDRRAVCVVKPASQGELMSEIAREEDGLHARIFFLQATQDLTAPITRSVVDEDQLEIVLRLLHDRRDRLIEMFEIVLLIEYGDNDRNKLHSSFSFSYLSTTSKVIAPSL